MLFILDFVELSRDLFFCILLTYFDISNCVQLRLTVCMGLLFTVNEYILFASQGGDPNFIIEKFRIKGTVPRDFDLRLFS